MTIQEVKVGIWRNSRLSGSQRKGSLGLKSTVLARQTTDTSVTKELANYAVKTKFEDYPREVIDKAKILILDNIGCMLGGSQTVLGKAMLHPIKSIGGREQATIVSDVRMSQTRDSMYSRFRHAPLGLLTLWQHS